jgi:hypothetical protein
MNALSKLEIAKKHLISAFSDRISLVQFFDEHFTLKIGFSSGQTLYVRYNDYSEYSYQFLFSSQEKDYIRYDNFDDRWDVPTRPHHFHTKERIVVLSKMIGNADYDIPLLIKKLLHYLN